MYPILRRLSGLQWVNQRVRNSVRVQRAERLRGPELLDEARPAPRPGEVDLFGELRRQVFNSFRNPEGTDNNQLPWPWIYGDAMDVPGEYPAAERERFRPRSSLALMAGRPGSSSASGARAGTDPSSTTSPRCRCRISRRCSTGLHSTFCLADAFHPGCEVTWPIRHLSMFHAPFRIRHRPPGVPEPDYGKKLTPAVALSLTGPLHAQGPGDLTRWMGLPWQADTGFCRSGYDMNYDPFVPTFWPAGCPTRYSPNRTIGSSSIPTSRESAGLRRSPPGWRGPLR